MERYLIKRLPGLLFLCFLCTCVRAQASTEAGQVSGIVFVCPPCNSACDELSFAAAGTCPHCSMTLVDCDSITQVDERRTVAFYLQSGVEVLDFAGPLEVLTYAGFEVFTVSKTKAPIISQGVLKVIPDYSVKDAPSADIIAVFGGNGFNTSQDTAVTNWIKRQQDVELYFSVCTGALILAETGILDGKTATTFHNALDALEENYPEVKVLRNVRYVDNGNVISTAGISAGIDGALHLVAKLKGYNAARATAYNMEYDNWRPNAGLLLSEDDPYRTIPPAAELSEYVGTYEHWRIPKLEIRYNERDLGLEAVYRGLRFPLYYQSKDVFTDVGGDTVSFERNEHGNIVGYRHSYDSDRVLIRL
jgi:putative intracellular protease/amidase